MNYYIKIGSKAFGPFPEQQILDLAAQGRINRSSPISKNGIDWYPAGNFAEIFPYGLEAKNHGESQLRRLDPLATNSAQSDLNAETAVDQRIWYVSPDGRSVNGPFSTAEVNGLIQKGSIVSRTLVGRGGEKMKPVNKTPVFTEALLQVGRNGSAGFQGAQTESGFFTIDTKSPPLQLSQEDADHVNTAFFWFYGVTLAALVSLILAIILSIICEGFYYEVGAIPGTGIKTMGYIFSFAFYAAYVVSLFLTLPFILSVWRIAFSDRSNVSPMRAVCLLLIPVFNLLWQFVVFDGLPKKLNKMLIERKSPTRASGAACVIYCIMNIVALGVPNLIIAPIAFNSLRRASVELVEMTVEENENE